MNAERLLALYEKVAEAPDAVPRLRRFVLDLAVRGKLVPQEAGEEPASEMLTTITSERNERVKRREIKRAAPLEPVEDAPFEAPAGWVWIPLGDTGSIFSGNSINATKREQLEKTDEGLPFIATKDVGYGLDVIDYENGLLVPASDTRFKVARAGSILICAEGGSAGRKIGLSDRAICFGNKLLANETWSVIVPDFVRFVYMSDFFFGEFAARMTGVIGGISIKNFLQLPFPLPPIAEQRRIVAKVEELMVLLDRLESARGQREATRDRLTAASLARLTAPDTDPADFPANARFALATLPALTTRPDQIKPLRQTILNLAVRGKLVDQDPTDEPASELLRRIDQWRQEAVRRKEIRLPRKQLQQIAQDDLPYQLPTGWGWARLGQLIYIQSGDGLTSSKMKDGDVPVYGGNGVTGHHDKANTFEPTIVIGRVGYYCGSIHVTPAEAWITDNAFRTRYSKNDIHQAFLELLLNATDLKEQENATAQPVISGSKIYPIVVGLPPFAEQHRIVAKVDALMALCDRLEAALTTTDTTRARLLDALLHEALDPAADLLDPAE